MLFISSAQAKTYIRDYTYQASDADSKLSSRLVALDEVRKLLLAELGTHIRSNLKINRNSSGSTIATEEIEALTAGVTKIKIIEEKWNGETYYLKAKMIADPDDVIKSLEELRKDTKGANELKEKHQELKNARLEIDKLRQQLTNTKSDKDKLKLANKYVKHVKSLSLEAWLKKYSSHKEAAVFFEKAEKAKNNDKYVQSTELYRRAAELGHKDSIYEIGKMYENGTNGMEKNLLRADNWYSKAPTKLNSYHSLDFGLKLHDEKLNDRAIYWLTAATKATEAGRFDSDNILYAAYALGTIYKKKPDSAVSIKSALEWFNVIVDSISIENTLLLSSAKAEIAQIYKNEKGETKNNKLAYAYLKEILDDNEEQPNVIGPCAHYYLGEMAEKGLAKSLDIDDAIKLYKSAINDKSDVSDRYNRLMKKDSFSCRTNAKKRLRQINLSRY